MTFAELELGTDFVRNGVTYKKCSVNKAHKKERRDGEGPSRFRAADEVTIPPVEIVVVNPVKVATPKVGK
jgi:hypothetical protein